MSKLIKGEYIPISSKYSPSLRKLLKRMLTVNIKLRPSIVEILKLSFIERHSRKLKLKRLKKSKEKKRKNMQNVRFFIPRARNKSLGPDPTILQKRAKKQIKVFTPKQPKRINFEVPKESQKRFKRSKSFMIFPSQAKKQKSNDKSLKEEVRKSIKERSHLMKPVQFRNWRHFERKATDQSKEEAKKDKIKMRKRKSDYKKYVPKSFYQTDAKLNSYRVKSSKLNPKKVVNTNSQYLNIYKNRFNKKVKMDDGIFIAQKKNK